MGSGWHIFVSCENWDVFMGTNVWIIYTVLALRRCASAQSVAAHRAFLDATIMHLQHGGPSRERLKSTCRAHRWIYSSDTRWPLGPAPNLKMWPENDEISGGFMGKLWFGEWAGFLHDSYDGDIRKGSTRQSSRAEAMGAPSLTFT